MRSGIRVVTVVLIAFTGVFTMCSLSAQSISPCVRQVRSNIGRAIFIPSLANVNPPYTATVKQTFEQILMDGNTIRWTIETVQARDEVGRTMAQHIEGCQADSSGQQQLIIQTNVYDPVSKTSFNWATGPGTMALTSISHQQGPFVEPDWKDLPRAPSAPYKPEIIREDLGSRTIAGMQATGTRLTETIPAGREGNDMPLKIVHETWMKHQSQTILLFIEDDPRTGHRTWEVESLTVGPPDPALFTPPANYKVWDPPPRSEAKPQ